ncbi:Oestrogen-responsive protein [Moelleriella libera RCEF 2490]|uniref:Oestrogen-responsive protein n=1 Tax=Moelleriella libera RCEF 2490 TaxID=1081109 RepID=A0A167XTU9_9HYPO|nr:Oestrogen-responsive protein [Moelleriella libera RCEF 2490]
MHAEHRGRTGKNPIVNHKVDYGYSKLVTGIRISMDKNGNLAECPIEFEVLQEFALAEKITLGHVKLNLSEYVEESEALGRDIGSPPRKRSSAGISPTAGEARAEPPEAPVVEEGIVRRYLMQDSKINSTLKIGILMVQVDGDRNFTAPPLKTAPVFGGIAGLVAPDVEDDTSPIPSISKPRDAAEMQDLYRRTLAASWSRQPNELPADECIEDIFSGGNGWRTKRSSSPHSSHSSASEDDGENFRDTLRPGDFRRLAGNHHHHQHQHQQQQQQQHHHHHHHRHGRHRRGPSGSSERSAATVTGSGSGSTPSRGHGRVARLHHAEDGKDSRDDDSGSLGSLAPTLGSRGEAGTRRAKEVDEFAVRDDLVAWKLPSSLTV